jgi:hypothetical protein
LKEGKSFRESALEAGYSLSVAKRGLKALMEDSRPFAEVYKHQAELSLRYADVTLTSLKPLAVKRLHHEITDLKSVGGLKAIEIAGRFKETDWFVKSNEAVNIGVFSAMTEALPSQDLDEYKDE